MERSFLAMKIVLLLVTFVIIPKFAIRVQAVNTTTHDQKHTTSLSKPSGDHQPLTELLHEQPPPSFSSAPLAFSPPRIPKVQADGIFCRKPSKRGMVAKVLKRLKAPKLVKSILSRSLKFGGCMAGKYCGCLRLRCSQAVALCFGIIGARCMKQAISDSVYGCTLSCTAVSINTNHKVDEVAIGGFCYNQCMKINNWLFYPSRC